MINCERFQQPSLQIHKMLAACSETRVEESSNALGAILYQQFTKKKKTQIQDQDVYQLSDFILVSRSVKINKANYKFKYVTTLKHLQI